MDWWKAVCSEYVYRKSMPLMPVAPSACLPIARQVIHGPGWAPSMFCFAMVFAHYVFKHLISDTLGPAIADGAAVAMWPIWMIVPCLAISIVSIHSIKNLRRLGLRSIGRFRVWFELSRLAWHLSMLTVVLIVAMNIVEMAFTLKLGSEFVLSALPNLFIGWGATGIVGYLLALIRWRLPGGRTFECVNFFLLFFVSMLLIYRLVDMDQPFDLLCGLLGFAVLAIYVQSMITSTEQMRRLGLRSEGIMD